MSVTDILASAQFVVNQRGKRTAAVLDMDKWRELMQWASAQESATPLYVEVGKTPPPIEKLEVLWDEADFWPEDESVDEFLATVRTWRKDDLVLHRETL